MDKEIYIVKANGEKEVFDIEKLKHSLIRAGASDKSVEEISQKVKGELSEGDTTDKIYKKAFSLLRKKSKIVASKYSVRRAILDLGPNGFPFEDFVGEIFRSKGYDVNIGETVNGKCVLHEMDVVAENAEEIIMAEVKFHNNNGIKSDLKTALYVKARFDDIEEGGFYQKHNKNKPLKRYLVTNTKFSSRAIKYSKCAGLNLIGWNFPFEGGHLQGLIDEVGLHPLTCLNSLKKKEKKDFLNRGIVLCKELKGPGKTLLKNIGLNESRILEVQDEIEKLCK